jgi:hypothetical protein
MDQPEQDQAAEALDQARDALSEHGAAAGASGVGAILGGMLLRRFRRSARRQVSRRRHLLKRFGWGALIVVLSVATCSYGVDSSTLTAPWGDPVRASRESAAHVLTRGAEVLQRAPESGGVRLTITETEATSALSLGLMMSDLMQVAGRIPQEELQQAADLDALRERIWAEADSQRRELAERAGFLERVLVRLDPRIRTGDVQVRFEPTGEVVMAGYVQAWRFRLPGLFVVAPSAGGGELNLDFVSGRLGRLPLPEFLFDWFGGMLARGVLLGQDLAQVSEISVSDGSLTFAASAAD